MEKQYKAPVRTSNTCREKKRSSEFKRKYKHSAHKYSTVWKYYESDVFDVLALISSTLDLR